MSKAIIIRVRYTQGTYVARCRGAQADGQLRV